MRWKHKPQEHPWPGKVRTRIKFALWPRLCKDNVTMVWLEKVKVTEAYYASYGGSGWDEEEVQAL